MSDAITDLQQWYLANCNGDWEHSWGIKIGTLDNPGWTVEIDLHGTQLADQPFARVEVDRSEHDWMRCWVKDNVFSGRCGRST